MFFKSRSDYINIKVDSRAKKITRNEKEHSVQFAGSVVSDSATP